MKKIKPTLVSITDRLITYHWFNSLGDIVCKMIYDRQDLVHVTYMLGDNGTHFVVEPNFSHYGNYTIRHWCMDYDFHFGDGQDESIFPNQKRSNSVFVELTETQTENLLEKLFN